MIKYSLFPKMTLNVADLSVWQKVRVCLDSMDYSRFVCHILAELGRDDLQVEISESIRGFNVVSGWYQDQVDRMGRENQDHSPYIPDTHEYRKQWIDSIINELLQKSVQ